MHCNKLLISLHLAIVYLNIWKRNILSKVIIYIIAPQLSQYTVYFTLFPVCSLLMFSMLRECQTFLFKHNSEADVINSRRLSVHFHKTKCILIFTGEEFLGLSDT